MKSKFFLPISLMTVAMAAASATEKNEPQPVTVAEKDDSVVLDNGIVSVEIGKRNGKPLSLRCGGVSVLGGKCGLNWHALDEEDMKAAEQGEGKDNNESYSKITAGRFGVHVDPTANGGEMADVSMTQKFSGSGAPFDVELHYVLRRGDSGFYNYLIFSHPQGYPAGQVSTVRMLFEMDESLFDFMTIDDARRRFMPPPNTPCKSLRPKESRLMTDGPFKGVIEDKYHNFADAGDHFVHGWESTRSRLGCWILYGSTEDQNGGPTKQHNTAHFPQVLMKISNCGHYGAARITVGTEQWQKFFGPWMVYLNSGGDKDQLWEDAKLKAAAQRAAWPYGWLNQPLYPPASERGTVKGRLHLSDPQDPKASPANAWVGLAAAKPDWQQQSNGYQFWVRADKEGCFTIPNVRTGDYTLYAFVDGVMDEFRRDGVSVEKGRTADLGALDWKPARYGRQLWQIGTPDRTAKEFRHGDDYRQWGLWLKYPEEFPRDVNFVIGKSDERTDWNFVHCTVQKNGEWVGTKWNVLFDLADSPKPGVATLRIALAAAHKATLRVSVNGKAVGSRRFETDNAMMRAGIHGQYSQWDLHFDAALLKPGQNTITLEQQSGHSAQKSAMYDCLRLEVAEAAGMNTQLEQSPEKQSATQTRGLNRLQAELSGRHETCCPLRERKKGSSPKIPEHSRTTVDGSGTRVACTLKPEPPGRRGFQSDSRTGLPAGERVRSFLTTSRTIWHARWMSEAELKRPNENRRLARARSFESPIAFSTCEGFTDPLVQADPAEQQSPS